jgi:hypothetical protein
MRRIAAWAWAVVVRIDDWLVRQDLLRREDACN